MKLKTDHLLLGLAVGLLLPPLSFYIFYLLYYDVMGFYRFIEYTIEMKTFVARTSLCVISNLAGFFLFIYTDRYRSARGVLLATLLWAGLIFYLKIFG